MDELRRRAPTLKRGVPAPGRDRSRRRSSTATSTSATSRGSTASSSTSTGPTRASPTRSSTCSRSSGSTTRRSERGDARRVSGARGTGSRRPSACARPPRSRRRDPAPPRGLVPHDRRGLEPVASRSSTRRTASCARRSPRQSLAGRLDLLDAIQVSSNTESDAAAFRFLRSRLARLAGPERRRAVRCRQQAAARHRRAGRPFPRPDRTGLAGAAHLPRLGAGEHVGLPLRRAVRDPEAGADDPPRHRRRPGRREAITPAQIAAGRGRVSDRAQPCDRRVRRRALRAGAGGDEQPAEPLRADATEREARGRRRTRPPPTGRRSGASR